MTGEDLPPGRYSHVSTPPPKINKVPSLVPTEQVSDAALVKRGLKRTGAARIASRATGATDPDNIKIIHLFDNERLPFIEIAKRLNDEKIAKGLKPIFTENSCHNRYNRNAPLLYATDGKEWVPLHKRRNYKRGKHLGVVRRGAIGEESQAAEQEEIEVDLPAPEALPQDNMEVSCFTWDAACDMALVEAEKEVDFLKWRQVAEAFHQKTGLKITPTQAAMRYKII
jgi:hypothetical protein